jgi:hypothetical protein
MYRESKTAPLRDGVAANARLTGGTAVMLLVLLALEGATIPLIHPLIGPHIFIGMLLIPPVVLKLGSTGYRFARYYAGNTSYRRKGPPTLPLRLLAPAVILSTLLLFGSGVALLLAGPESGGLTFIHKASFIAWFAFITLHVLGHLLHLPRLALPDWRRAGGREAELAGSSLRIAALAGSLVAGIVLATVTISLAGPWLSAQAGG